MAAVHKHDTLGWTAVSQFRRGDHWIILNAWGLTPRSARARLERKRMRVIRREG